MKETQLYYYNDDKSHKFWEITYDSEKGGEYKIRFGKIGSKGCQNTKIDTLENIEKLIQTKIKKGYIMNSNQPLQITLEKIISKLVTLSDIEQICTNWGEYVLPGHDLTDDIYYYLEMLADYKNGTCSFSDMFKQFKQNRYILKIIFIFSDNVKYYMFYTDEEPDGGIDGFITNNKYKVLEDWGSLAEFTDEVLEEDKKYLLQINKYFDTHYEGKTKIDSDDEDGKTDEYFEVFTLLRPDEEEDEKGWFKIVEDDKRIIDLIEYMKTDDADNALNNINNKYYDLDEARAKRLAEEQLQQTSLELIREKEKKAEEKEEKEKKAEEKEKHMKQASKKWNAFIYNTCWLGGVGRAGPIFDIVRWMLQYLHPGENITDNICISEMDKLKKFCVNSGYVIDKTEFLKYFEKKVAHGGAVEKIS